MQKLLVEVLCPVLCKRSGCHPWMVSSVLRICKTQVFQLPKFFPHFTSFLSFLQWDEWFLKMKIINIFKISINSDKDWVNRGQYGESESLAWDMPTARLRCCTSGTSNQMREQPAITGRTDGISPFYLSTLRPQAAYLFYYFFFLFPKHSCWNLLNKKYEKEIGPSCVQTTETHTNDQPKLSCKSQFLYFGHL